MKSICFDNCNMGSESYAILCRTAKRLLGEREVGFAPVSDDPSLVITLTVNDSFENDRFVIEADCNGVVLTAANDCALHSAFGRFLTESHFDGAGSFKPYTGTIDFTPESPLRGMYFATHFFNFYHTAPLEEVYEVVEDLAMRGCNNLLVWFDMHHYSSMEDEGAQLLVKRLRAILGYANRIGIKGSMIMLGNEAFDSSPVELRADWHIQGDYFEKPVGHYHREICPSKDGGVDEIIKERRRMISCFTGLDIEYVVFWPYDQGGCTCQKCQPWGANGFLRLLPHIKALLAEMMPKTKLILSTWYFDRFIKGEWDAFYPHMTDGTLSGVDYIMSFFFKGEMPECLEKKGVPEGVRFIDFPEISMYSCTPWGGYGASVLTDFLGTTNSKTTGMYSGGFPYSEGVFEDINKYIELTWYSGLYQNAADAVRSYVKFYFCLDGEQLDELTDAVIRTETGLARTEDYTCEPACFTIQDTSDVEYCYRVITKYNSLLPEKIRSSYRFRLLYLRSVIDRELVTFGGYALHSTICQDAMNEINTIYHTVPETIRWVKAPVNK